MASRDFRLRVLPVLMVALSGLLSTVACSMQTSQQDHAQEIVQSGNGLVIGEVVLRGINGSPLSALKDHSGYTNGTDSFFTTKLTDGGTFVLYRFAPHAPTITMNPYPEIVMPGTKFQYVKPIPTTPFYAKLTVTPPSSFPTPFSQFKWPALLTNAGAGLFAVAESPIFEEAIEPFFSAYPTVKVTRTGNNLNVRFDEAGSPPKSVTLKWSVLAHTKTSTTYIATISDPASRAIAIRLAQPATAKRVWYFTGSTWKQAQTEFGASSDPDLLVIHTEQPSQLLIESESGSPADQATLYSVAAGYVNRARWAAFTIYQHQIPDEFFDHSMAPSMEAYNARLYSLRDQAPATSFPSTWRNLLQLVAFTRGKNLLNPKFFDQGFSAAGDPSFEYDPQLNVSVSWVSDEAALQAVMGERLFGLSIDPRYGQGVRAFYDPGGAFYYGGLNRATGKFTSADTGSDDRVIGYNYLLSLMRLTELIGSSPGLPSSDVEQLIDRALPVLQQGYFGGYSQVPYLWKYPEITSGLQAEYGMGRELSESQLSYICGLWWLKTHEPRYLDCEMEALRLPMEAALTLRGSSYLFGLDVVHGGYVTDALLLAYRTTGNHRYLDAATKGWRQELIFLFSKLNYPETFFDDRGVAVTTYYSTFADLHQGNYWRDDAWNNERTLWSLAKLLAYVDDPQIAWLLASSRETHKQSMPEIDRLYYPVQRSGFYFDKLIDSNDYELSYEALQQHYSTQVAFSNDVWREAFLYESVESPSADAYRIPGAVLSDAGLVYVVGKPGAEVQLKIQTRDCTFEDGTTNTTVRLNASGTARVQLRART